MFARVGAYLLVYQSGGVFFSFLYLQFLVHYAGWFIIFFIFFFYSIVSSEFCLFFELIINSFYLFSLSMN